MHDHPSTVTRKQKKIKKTKIADSIPSHTTLNTIFMIKKMYSQLPTPTKTTPKPIIASETTKNVLSPEIRHTNTLAPRSIRQNYRLRAKVGSKRLNR